MSERQLFSSTVSANVSRRLKDYVMSSTAETLAISQQLQLSNDRVIYNSIMSRAFENHRRIVNMRRNQFRDESWSRANNSTYLDAYGVPYRKDGSVVVVIANSFERRRVGKYEISGPREAKVGFANYDQFYNRIVIAPWFAEALRQERVQYFGVDGQWHNAKLKHVILHEWGHSADTKQYRSVLTDRFENGGAEVSERLGQEITGDVARVPHGVGANGESTGFRFKGSDGVWRKYVSDPSDSEAFLVSSRTVAELQAEVGLQYDPDAVEPDDLSRQFAKDALSEVQISSSLGLLEATRSVAEGLANIDGGQLGLALGSVLGQRVTNNPFGQIAASALLSTTLGSLGEYIDERVFGSTEKSTWDLVGTSESSFTGSLGANLKSAGTGALSSYLTAELIQAVGIEGFAAELTQTVAGSYVTAIISNLDKLAIPAGTTGHVSFSGITVTVH